MINTPCPICGAVAVQVWGVLVRTHAASCGTLDQLTLLPAPTVRPATPATTTDTTLQVVAWSSEPLLRAAEAVARYRVPSNLIRSLLAALRGRAVGRQVAFAPSALYREADVVAALRGLGVIA